MLASPRRTQQVGCLGLWPGEHHERPRKRQFKLDRTYRLVVPRPSLKFSGPGEGQSARPPAKARERAVSPFHRLQRTKPPASLVLTFPSIQRNTLRVNVGLPPAFSVRKRLPPRAALVGNGQSGCCRSVSLDDAPNNQSAVPVTATGHCPDPVLSRRAKTSFPGREAAPLRFAAPSARV